MQKILLIFLSSNETIYGDDIEVSAHATSHLHVIDVSSLRCLLRWKPRAEKEEEDDEKKVRKVQSLKKAPQKSC